MSLSKRFIEAMTRKTYKTNVVVVFSPKDTFYSTVNAQTPGTNSAFDGSQSYIFWKREPDQTQRTPGTSNERLDIKNQFEEFLTGRLTTSQVPLDCVDSVSISGGEIDVKDASVQDDGVEINMVLQNPKHKSFFQELFGYNVEIYFGFSGQGFNFYDYERFYVGKMNGLSSPDNLSLQIKVGTLVDFWNKTWVHSQKLRPTKTAYKYPLDVDFKKQNEWNDLRFKGRNPNDVNLETGLVGNFDFKSDLYRAIKDVGDFSWNYEYNYPRWTQIPGTVPPPGRFTEDKQIKRTSAIFFTPSGTREHIKDVTPDVLHPGGSNDYPDVDRDFLRARGNPENNNRIRFVVDDTIFESSYIDVYIFWPLVLVQTGIRTTPSSGNRWFIFDVERMPNEPDAAQSADVSVLNRLTPLSNPNVLYEYVLDDVTHLGQPFNNTLDRYTSIFAKSHNYGHMNRLKFATKLRIFAETDPEDITFDEIDSGADVMFYDTKTGIGEISEVLVNTLSLNLGINTNLIDQSSFNNAKDNYESLMKIPPRYLAADLDPANVDYCITEEDDATEHIQDTILKSNNLRMYIERGVLKCLFLESREKAILQEEVNGEMLPFLISEDDILESTTYEARPDDQVKRLKIKTSFARPNSDYGSEIFYCVDARNQDRTAGSVLVSRSPGTNYLEDDFEEIEVRQHFTDSTRTANHFDRRGFGFARRLYKELTNFSQSILMAHFATYYFDAVNPFIKLTVVTGARGLLVSVGDVIIVRDHKAFELFGNQFIKAFVINKSVEDWGTDNIKVTLDLFYCGKSTDYITAERPDRPTRLRLLSLVANPEDNSQTQVAVTWDEPDDWGHSEDDDLFTYRLYEATPSGDKFLASLPEGNSKSDGFVNWEHSNRHLSLNLNNDRTYRLFVRADNGVFEGPASNVLEFNTLRSVVEPSAPLNLRISGSDRSVVNLAWDAASNLGGAQSLTYNVYVNGRRVTNTGRQLFYNYPFGTHSAGDTLTIHVTAENEAGQGPASNSVTFVVPQPLPVPEGMIQLSGVATGIDQVRLTWSATITRGDVGVLYALHRSTVEGSIGPAIIDSVFDSPIVDANLEPDTTYYYTIVARNESGEGVNSPQVGVTTLARIVRTRPQPPGGFRLG